MPGLLAVLLLMSASCAASEHLEIYEPGPTLVLITHPSCKFSQSFLHTKWRLLQPHLPPTTRILAIESNTVQSMLLNTLQTPALKLIDNGTVYSFTGAFHGELDGHPARHAVVRFAQRGYRDSRLVMRLPSEYSWLHRVQVEIHYWLIGVSFIAG